ncbi:MAG: SAM-dependent methyltransferase [Opitutales bacterium]
MLSQDTSLPMPDILRQALNARAGEARWMPFVDFMDIVLFEPGAGYYTAGAERVGRQADRDFYTASTLGPLFGRLVVEALVNLLGEANAAEFDLLEIGAEPGVYPFNGLDLPFAGYRRIGSGERIEVPRRAVVFANELLDAQPCVRMCFHGGHWREIGVTVAEDGTLGEILAPYLSRDAAALLPRLPDSAPEGYRVDYSLRAEALLEQIVNQPWEGVLLTFDYGKTWPELLESTPQGTARAYYRHRQQTDLLARPGQQDLTSDVAWDRLLGILRAFQFSGCDVRRQESFFVHHAAEAVRAAMENGSMEQRRTLGALLHPAHFGARFQALYGRRLKG